MARLYETAVVLVLLGTVVFGIAWVASAFFDDDKSSKQTLFGKVFVLLLFTLVAFFFFPFRLGIFLGLNNGIIPFWCWFCQFSVRILFYFTC